MGLLRASAKGLLGLSELQRQTIRIRERNKWNRRVRKERHFIPSELMETISVEDAVMANKSIGIFATEYLKEELKASSHIERLQRVIKKKKILAIGYGWGYDSLWFKEATVGGLWTNWLDVSSVVVDAAKKDLDRQFQALDCSAHISEPRVREDELHGFLLGEEDNDWHDWSSVEIWYLCRVIGCFPGNRAKEVIQLLGSKALSPQYDPEKTHKVALVLALRDDNQNRVASTSRLYKRAKLLSYLEAGAERKLEVVREEKYTYFDQVYTAMTVMAK